MKETTTPSVPSGAAVGSSALVRQKLWRVNLRSHMERYNPSYVVAPDATEAYRTVRNDLDKRDYGFPKERELLSVELVAEDYEYTETGSRLFLPNYELSHRSEPVRASQNKNSAQSAHSDCEQ